MEFPENMKYTDNDEWLRVEDDIGAAGITDYAQNQLSDVVYVEVTVAIGDKVTKGEVYGLIESVKAAADVYMPVTGVIIEINETLVDTPELVNTDPYGEAWLVKFEITDSAELDELLEVQAYKQSVEERSS